VTGQDLHDVAWIGNTAKYCRVRTALFERLRRGSALKVYILCFSHSFSVIFPVKKHGRPIAYWLPDPSVFFRSSLTRIPSCRHRR
jgi:hypothetical protein